MPPCAQPQGGDLLGSSAVPLLPRCLTPRTNPLLSLGVGGLGQGGLGLPSAPLDGGAPAASHSPLEALLGLGTGGAGRQPDLNTAGLSYLPPASCEIQSQGCARSRPCASQPHKEKDIPSPCRLQKLETVLNLDLFLWKSF